MPTLTLDSSPHPRSEELERLRQENAALKRSLENLQREHHALRQIDARNQVVLENLPVGVWLLDADGSVIYGNPAGQDIWGGAAQIRDRAPAEFQAWHHDSGKPLLPEDWAGAIALKERRKVLNQFIEIEGFDGVRRTILQSAAPVLTGEKITGAAVFTLDVTERASVRAALKSAEFTSRERRERLEAALSASHTGTFVWNIRSNTLQWDEELDRLFGLPPTRTAQSIPDFFALVHPDDRARVAEACERCRKFGHDFHEEFRVVWPDGSIHWLEDKGKTFFAPDGKPLYMTGACVDITARKQTDQAMRIARERFELVRSASGVGFWFCDLPFGRLDWDQRVKEHFGLPPDATVTIDTFFERIHPDDRERTRLSIERATTQSQPYDVEYRTVGLDGAVRWIRAIGTAYVDHKGGGRFDGITIDITENVQNRELLKNRGAELERLVAQRTSKLQETVAELEKFSYSISHDLRAPLRAMQSFAQCLAEDFGDRLPPEGHNYLRRIIAGSERMDRLIQDVLSYSRLARTEIAPAAVEVQPLIEGIIETYANLHHHRGSIVVSGPLPVLQANDAALTQVVSNLLGNAVKFSREGVPLHVRVWSEDKGDRVRVCVADNGIGIAPQHQERIFGVFEQLDATRGGTGIGLAIVKKAVERMGGAIGVKSEVGQGSTFWFELPVAGGAGAGPTAAADAVRHAPAL